MAWDFGAVALRILHIGAAILAAGAAFFQWRALHPTLAALAPEQRRPIREAVVARWRPVVFACIAILLVTGLINFVAYKIPAYKTHPLKGMYHGLLGVKILAALLSFHCATVLALPGAKGEKYRDRAGFWLTALVVSLAVVIVIAAVLNNFPAA